MSWLLLGGGWAQLWVLVVVLLLLYAADVQCADDPYLSRSSFRHPIKINPGTPAAMPTPTPPSHTFTLPDPSPPSRKRLPDPALYMQEVATPTTIHNQADAIRATKTPGHKPPTLPLARAPANFSLPPALLPDVRDTTTGGAGGGPAVDVRFDEVFEEALWRRWDGDCMYARLDEYRYELCPFHNITQRSTRMSGLKVALGVWSGWWTTPEHQLAMNYTDGTDCNEQLNRSVTVILHCSAPRSVTQSDAPLPPIDTLAEYSPSYIGAVNEPSTCTYRMHWYTPLVCSAYRRAADELSSSTLQPNSQLPTSADKQQQDEIGQRRSQLEKELEMEDTNKVKGASEVSLAARGSAELRDYLDCIAAMTVPSADADSYHASCAAFLPLSQPERFDEYDEKVT